MCEIGDITENEGGEEEEAVAQEELQLEEKLKLLSWAAESSTIALITADYSGHLNYVNPVVLKMWGYRKEEFLGRHCSEFWHLPSEIFKAGKECRDKGEWTGELVARRRDGTLFDAHVSLNLIRDDDGKPIGLMGTCFDITERKLAENELKKRTEELSLAKQRLDLALEASGMGTWDWDVASNRLTWDERLFRLVGVSGKEFEQTHDSLMELSDKIMPPEDQKKMQKALQDVVEGKTDDYKLEHGVMGLDGTYRCFAVKGHAHRNSKGELLRLVGTTQDITERKAAEEALGKSRADLARAQAMAHLGNYSLDIQTGEVSWSEELGAIWGCIPGEKLSFEEIVSRIHPEDRDRVLETARMLQEEDRPFSVEYRIIRPDGSVRNVHDRAELTRDETGIPVRMFGTIQDITDRKQMEGQLHKSREEAEAANRAKGEFLANMSHEIRTPMNAVMGMLELLRDTDLNEEQREYLRLAHLSSESLLSIIDDILDFSRIEQDKLELELIGFDPRSSISQIMNVMGSRAASRGIELIAEVGADVPDFIIGDPVRLKQVLFNLIGNAIKFTEMGKVVLSVETCKGRAPEANGGSETKEEPDAFGEPEKYGEPETKGETKLLFKVRDTGTGIPPENLERIFDAFTQADASITRKYGGTGLGLSISSQLVELMGGRIRVRSEVGKGSTFYFTIKVKKGAGDRTRTGTGPYRSVSSEETPVLEMEIGKKTGEAQLDEKTESLKIKEADKLPLGTGLNILLADDHLINQKLVISLLEKKGHKVTLAGNGEEVLSILSKKDFDLVLMDVQMPVMDGLEATRRIRNGVSSVKRPSIPIIALTARAMKEDRNKCLEAGMNDYLSKPLKKGELFMALERVRSGTRVRGTEVYCALPIPDSGPVFDLEKGLERTEGDEELLTEMVRIFLDAFPELLAELEKAVMEGDFEAAGRNAHKLKSSAGIIGADRVFTAAKGLENTGRVENKEGKMEETSKKLEELKLRLEELESVLVKFLSAQS